MKYPLTIFLLPLLILVGCRKEDSRENAESAYLELAISVEMNGSPFVPGQDYSTVFGETLRPDALRFYIGQYRLSGQESAEQFNDSYQLFDLAKPETHTLRVPIQPGTYDQINLLLGVDSARNVSGVQTGALDPVLGMFWTWNSGYIFLKFEGHSDASPEPDKIFQYHIGGFRSPWSAIRTFQAILNQDEQWVLTSGQTLHLDLTCQLDLFFNASLPLRIADTPVEMTPGENSARLADNFAGSFSLTNWVIQ
ncbi:MbnP family protein [Flavihumibacter petaseus]|uniref:Copper-binding protein MbnP-like domain-containing protein n=1 Tax=Flavihumibacter petaseus NBRC 106054 TaxID=1220578 RepID=A0A0E9MW08_9BACT|nr:MbnP family protein [Flavihumibacter petaseus]GAO41688.1 hypothetical protein FPE01S_01_07020 [Flavihumibacter petaseus NBRC 106054]